MAFNVEAEGFTNIPYSNYDQYTTLSNNNSILDKVGAVQSKISQKEIEKSELKEQKKPFKEAIAKKLKELYGPALLGIAAYQSNYKDGSYFSFIRSNMDYYFPGVKAERERKEKIQEEISEINKQLKPLSLKTKEIKAEINSFQKEIEDVESLRLLMDLFGGVDTFKRLPFLYHPKDILIEGILPEEMNSKIVRGEDSKQRPFIATRLKIWNGDNFEYQTRFLTQETGKKSQWNCQGCTLIDAGKIVDQEGYGILQTFIANGQMNENYFLD